jgi:O-antigen/teichoic acid export membrane protein
VASLTKRTIILIICRVFNFGVLALSPLFLVRIFDIRSYGQYREFVLYALMISGVIEFSINTNLIYFIPKYPGRERQSVTHTTLLILAASTLGLVALYLLRGVILARTSYDFVLPLILFIFFNLNLDFFENYWLGRKRTDYVLYYSSARVTVRTAAIIVSAAVSRDVMVVLKTMVIVEFAKCLFVFFMLRSVLTRRLDRALLREQLGYILPLGSSATISLVNNQLANLFVSIKLGVERLALYTTGAYQIPVINIVRVSVTDVLFPEMAQIGDAERLRLWQRANVVFCFLIFPVYVVFFYYAPTVIETLFTRQYVAAIPLFRIYLTLLVLQCFEMATPLRAMNRNKYFIFGSALDLSADLGLLLLLFRYVGFLTAALTFIIGETVLVLYLGSRIISLYRVGLGGLLMWKKVLTIAGCALIGLPVLIASRWIGMNAVARAVAFSLAYLILYYAMARRFRIDEVELLVAKFSGGLRRLRG